MDDGLSEVEEAGAAEVDEGSAEVVDPVSSEVDEFDLAMIGLVKVN